MCFLTYARGSIIWIIWSNFEIISEIPFVFPGTKFKKNFTNTSFRPVQKIVRTMVIYSSFRGFIPFQNQNFDPVLNPLLFLFEFNSLPEDPVFYSRVFFSFFGSPETGFLTRDKLPKKISPKTLKISLLVPHAIIAHAKSPKTLIYL